MYPSSLNAISQLHTRKGNDWEAGSGQAGVQVVSRSARTDKRGRRIALSVSLWPRLSGLPLRRDGRHQALDVADAVSPTRSRPAHHGRDMVRNDDAAEVHLLQRAHEPAHVGVTVIDEGLHEMRDRRAGIAEMYFPKL